MFVAVEFLSDCIVPATRFLHQAKEKTWSNYHHAFIKNRTQIVEVVGSSRDASFLCQKIVEKMISIYIDDDTDGASSLPKPPEIISEGDIDILSYIGGSILQKQRQSLKRKGD